MLEDLVFIALSHVLNPRGTSDLSKRKEIDWILRSLSTKMSQKECCDTKKRWCNFLKLNDSTCQFYYKVNTCVRPYKKSGRGVTLITNIIKSILITS